MIAVPEAGRLPRTPEQPARSTKARMTSSGKPSGYVGKGRSRRRPPGSQSPGRAVFPGRYLAHPAVAGQRRLDRRHAFERGDAAQAKPGQVGQRRARRLADVAERVAALVAVTPRIRLFADADAVEDDRYE